MEKMATKTSALKDIFLNVLRYLIMIKKYCPIITWFGHVYCLKERSASAHLPGNRFQFK